MTIDPPKRRRGRPRIDPSRQAVDVHVTLSAQAYDRLYAVARAHDLSVPEVLRRGAQRWSAPPNKPER